MTEYRFEKVTKDRLPDLIHLFRDAFGQKVELSYLEKKFDTAYTGKSYIGYIAYGENNEPAAFNAAFPLYATVDNKRILAAQLGDGMTAKKHQGKGLFTKVATMTHELAKAEGIEFIFGFTNENSYPTFKHKLKWEFTHNLILYKKRIYTLPVAPIAAMSGALQKVYLKFIHTVFNRLSIPKSEIRFQNSNVSAGYNGIEYSPEYLRYRCFSDNYFIEHAGCVGWVSVTNSLMIGDMNINEEEHCRKLLSSLKRICALTGIVRIAAICSPGSPLNKVFSQTFDTYDHYPAGFIALSERARTFDFATIKFNAADIDTY